MSRRARAQKERVVFKIAFFSRKYKQEQNRQTEHSQRQPFHVHQKSDFFLLVGVRGVGGGHIRRNLKKS